MSMWFIRDGTYPQMAAQPPCATGRNAVVHPRSIACTLMPASGRVTYLAGSCPSNVSKKQPIQQVSVTFLTPHAEKQPARSCCSTVFVDWTCQLQLPELLVHSPSASVLYHFPPVL